MYNENIRIFTSANPEWKCWFILTYKQLKLGDTNTKDLWHFDRVSDYFSDASQKFPK